MIGFFCVELVAIAHLLKLDHRTERRKLFKVDCVVVVGVESREELGQCVIVDRQAESRQMTANFAAAKRATTI